jgi:hypothetical protein
LVRSRFSCFNSIVGRNSPPTIAKFQKSKSALSFAQRSIQQRAHHRCHTQSCPLIRFQRERTVMALSHAPVTIPSRKTRKNVRSMNAFIERSWRCSRTCRNAALQISRLTHGSPARSNLSSLSCLRSMMQSYPYQQETNDDPNRDNFAHECSLMSPLRQTDPKCCRSRSLLFPFGHSDRATGVAWLASWGQSAAGSGSGEGWQRDPYADDPAFSH